MSGAGDVLYLDPTLVPVTAELEWEWGPFYSLARRIHVPMGLPDWKYPETARNLRRIFDFAISDGKSFDGAWAHTESQIQRILAANEDLQSLP